MNRFQKAVSRVASRHIVATTGASFTHEVQIALHQLQDAVAIAEDRSTDSPETGEAFADWNPDGARAVGLIRDFASKITPLLRRIK